MNARVERVHVPGNGNVLQVHLFVNQALHHTAKLGGNGGVDIGVKVTVIYSSGGRMVAVQSQRERLGAMDAKGVDSGTVRCKLTVPFGNQRPDPGTKFTARAQVFTALPGNVDIQWGKAE